MERACRDVGSLGVIKTCRPLAAVYLVDLRHSHYRERHSGHDIFDVFIGGASHLSRRGSRNVFSECLSPS